MDKQRSRFTDFGPDYDGVDLPVLLSDYSIIISSFETTFKEIRILKRKIEWVKNVFRDHSEIINFLDYCSSLFSDFQKDIKRVSQEAKIEVRDNQPECLNQIVERFGYERKETRDFINSLFEIPGRIKNDPCGLALKISDEMRDVLYGQFVHNRVHIARLSRRLRVFIGSGKRGGIPLATKAIIPFPAEGITRWQDVSIRFLSPTTVELRAGKLHRGNEFREIGFENRKTGKFNIAWLILAEFGLSGTLDLRESRNHRDGPASSKIIKQIQGLNRLLQNIFFIKGNQRPINFDRVAHRYRANINVSLAYPGIYREIMDSFREYSVPRGTAEDVREMKYHRKD